MTASEDRGDSTRALVRDEARLRAAITAHRDRVHDAAATEELKHRLDDVLESIQRVALDDDLWEPVDGNERLPHGRKAVEELAEIAWVGLPPLLEAVGYRSPPAPSATELVHDTVAALADVAHLDRAARSEVPDVVAKARRRLVMLRLRVHRDIARASPSTRPSVVRRAAKYVGPTAQALISTAVAALAAGAVESVLPTGATLPFALKWGEKVGEKAVELVTARFLSDRLHLGAESQEERQGAPELGIAGHHAPAPDPTPVNDHVVALTTALDEARRLAGGPARELREYVALARRHYDRLVELDRKPGDWCTVHEALDLGIARLEKLVRSPDLCRSTFAVSHEAHLLAARLG